MLGLLQSPDGVAVQVKIELEVLRIPQNAPFIPLQSSLGRRSLLTRHSISDGGRRRRQPSTFNIPISLTFSGLPDVFTQLISISRQISHSASLLKGILGYFQIVYARHGRELMGCPFDSAQSKGSPLYMNPVNVLNILT
jgi:hypothetical protein